MGHANSIAVGQTQLCKQIGRQTRANRSTSSGRQLQRTRPRLSCWHGSDGGGWVAGGCDGGGCGGGAGGRSGGGGGDEAGSGGAGCLSFRREKFVPRGGPDGGDGGAGGSVYVTAITTKNTLVDFRFHPEFKARRGQHGQGSNRTGRTAEDLEIAVPVGTLVFEKDSQDAELRLLGDLAEEGQRVLVAKGGRGGRGNARFVSSTNRAPRRTEPGEDGEEKLLRLQLKLIADVGLVGFPNAGKSTLISRISAAASVSR